MTARKLHLYGDLAEQFGPVHDVVATTLTEAVQIVTCNHPTFRSVVRRGNWHVAIGGEDLDDAREMLPHHLTVPSSRGDWHLVPVIAGGKSRTGKIIFSIIVGGALLATGIGGAISAGWAGAGVGGGIQFAASTGVLGLSYGTVALMGASVFLGGISQLLSPVPQTSTASKSPTSFSFDGPTEVEDEGGPIHIILGEVITAGIRAAASIEASNSGSLSQFDNTKFGMLFGRYDLMLKEV